MATPAQIRYALSLLGNAGYPTAHMSAKYSNLGASMRQRSGSVEAWLNSLSGAEVSKLIDKLK